MPAPESEMTDAEKIARSITLRLEHMQSEAHKRPFGIFLSPSTAAIGNMVKEVINEYLAAAHAKGMEDALDQVAAEAKHYGDRSEWSIESAVKIVRSRIKDA